MKFRERDDVVHGEASGAWRCVLIFDRKHHRKFTAKLWVDMYQCFRMKENPVESIGKNVPKLVTAQTQESTFLSLNSNTRLCFSGFRQTWRTGGAEFSQDPVSKMISIAPVVSCWKQGSL